MAGNTISLFPIMMVGMMLVRPVQTLFGYKEGERGRERERGEREGEREERGERDGGGGGGGGGERE